MASRVHLLFPVKYIIVAIWIAIGPDCKSACVQSPQPTEVGPDSDLEVLDAGMAAPAAYLSVTAALGADEVPVNSGGEIREGYKLQSARPQWK